MVFTLEEIKQDLKNQSDKEFYTKHIIRSDNWYFEHYMNKSPDEILKLIDDYRLIISESFGVSFNSVIMVGSSKLGFSLSPKSSKGDKLFKPFNDDDKIRKISDIDIAIISSELFHYFWSRFRVSYKKQYFETYTHVFQELYRGFINERNLMEVEGCRKDWNEKASISKNKLHTELYFKHDVQYRLYRSWEDFEDYNLQSIRKIQREEML